ncbi:stathmin domain-containing protein 1 isoform X2 [Melanotaenia boesemani]|uniref:stathmin domain-containing protein 1 isoform X2 n=1 Tax=Melanotaenia boesemani TaxID=1250792 RepID=UPI001C05A451|nr:stathmin domain-containing protein 1 isoform X2 [Melanotaenia boesemani]
MTFTSLSCLGVKMGCGSSTYTAVHPLTKTNEDQDETGSKLDGRGDSAVSKVTTDSGVVMENREILPLTGPLPSKLPPLTSESIRESEVERVTQDGLLQQESPVKERLRSSDILEELLSHGIIPEGQIREKGSGSAYSIVLNEKEGIMRRPPARLESLKAKKAQSFHSKEEFDQKMRLVEERRKFKEVQLKTRLRTKSARVRDPATISSIEEDDSSLTPVELLQLPLTPDQTPAPQRRHQIPREPAEGGEWVREARCNSRAFQEEDRENRNQRREVAKDGEKEEGEVTQVEELKADELFTVSGELESDFSFQHPDNKEEIF